jgi:hypothetical protein
MLLLLLLVVVLLVACGGGEAATNIPLGTSVETTTPADPLEGWIEYTGPDGDFTIRMPEQPQVQQETIDTAEGEVTISFYLVEADKAVWLVSSNTMPPLTAEAIASGDEQAIAEILQGGRDGALNNINGTLEQERTIEVSGNPGVELQFSAPGEPGTEISELKGIARMILAGPMLYQVMFLTVPEDMDETATAYLDSFRVTGE